jgi:predicted RNA binding protein YcfA (HicA-like mRNA interferase family)
LGKLRILSGKEVCQILERHGFSTVRRRGSHVVMQKKTDASTITVPVPDHDEIKTGTPNPSFGNRNFPQRNSELDVPGAAAPIPITPHPASYLP